MTRANASRPFTAAGDSPGTSSACRSVCHRLSPTLAACACSRCRLVAPMPRLGVLTMRSRRCVSSGFTRIGEVGDEVADLGALVELGPADDLVGDRVAAELLLEHAALRVGAVEDGDLVGPVGPVRAVRLALQQLLHLAGDELRLGALVADLHDLDERALPSRGPQVLALAPPVVGDHRVGGVEDLLRGAVVLLEADDLGVRVVALELEDVADVGAAPRVDALVVVADHGEVAVRAREEVGEPVLGVVGVLVLVDEHVAERAAGSARAGPG